MSVLQGVLFEEIGRLERNIASYEKMLASLPRGSIFVRKMGNSYFVYRKRKDDGIVVSEYLGKKENEQVQKQIELSMDYKRIKNNIRIAKLELAKLKRAYRVYE